MSESSSSISGWSSSSSEASDKIYYPVKGKPIYIYCRICCMYLLKRNLEKHLNKEKHLIKYWRKLFM